MDNGTVNYQLFLEGNDDAFVEIVREYKDGLIFYLNSITNNIHIAEDLAEDTFVKLGIRKPKDNVKASFKTWLYAIGRNVAIDHLRRNARLCEVSIGECTELLADEESLEKAYIREERKILIHKALRRLKPEYKQILWLTYFENFSNKESARIMKKSVHGIETLVYRARLALKTELQREGFVYEDL